MAWLYERPLTRGGTPNRPWAESDRRTEDGFPKGSGRRSLHWRHLKSNIVIGEDVDQALRVSPRGDMKQRRRSMSPLARRIQKEGYPMEFEEKPERRGGKKHITSRIQQSSLQTSSLAVPLTDLRYAKRQVTTGRQDALDDHLQPREYRSESYSTKRTYSDHLAAIERTGRVLDTQQEPMLSPRGIRCVKPVDEIPLGEMVGSFVRKEDRGRRCGYYASQPLFDDGY